MAARLGIRKVRRLSGRIDILYSDKVSLQFDNMAALRDWAQEIDGDSPQVVDMLRRLIVRWALFKDNTGGAASMEGKEIRFDLAGAVLMEVL